MQSSEALRGHSVNLFEKLGLRKPGETPEMNQFMLNAHDFLHRNQIIANHSTLFEVGYQDYKNKRGIRYVAHDRVRRPHNTWIFLKEYGEKKTRVHLVDDYSREIIPVEVYGKDALDEAIILAEQNLVIAQKSIIKSPMDAHFLGR